MLKAENDRHSSARASGHSYVQDIDLKCGIHYFETYFKERVD